MMEQKISLLISGNKISNGGFDALIVLADPIFENTDEAYTGFEENEYIFLLNQTDRHQVFTLFSSKVTSYAANRRGRMKIGISIPKGWKIVGNISPCKVLSEVYAEFAGSNMTYSSAYNWYSFKNEDYKSEKFQAILEKYELEPYTGPYVLMKGQEKGYVLAGSDEKIEMLFADPQYPEFESYSEIVIAKTGAPKKTPITICIPRKRTYAVYVNRELKETLTDVNKYFDCQPEVSGLYKEADPIHFSIQDLRDNPNDFNNIKIDDSLERIDCAVVEHIKVYACKLKFENKTNVSLGNEGWNISVNYRPLNLSSTLLFELQGDEIEKDISIQYTGKEDYELSADGAFYKQGDLKCKVSEQNSLRVFVRKRIKEPVSKKATCNDSKKQSENGKVGGSDISFNGIPLKLYFIPQYNVGRFDKIIRVHVVSCEGFPERTFSDVVKLERETNEIGGDTEKRYAATVYLNAYWVNADYIKVECRSDKYTYHDNELRMNASNENLIELKQNRDLTKFINRFRFSLLRKRLLILLILLVGIAIGVGSMWSWKNINPDSKSESTDTPIEDSNAGEAVMPNDKQEEKVEQLENNTDGNSNSATTSSSAYTDQDKQTYDGYSEELTGIEFEFSSLEDIEEWLSSMTQLDEEEEKVLSKRVAFFKTIAEAVQNKRLDVLQQNEEHCFLSQKQAIQALFRAYYEGNVEYIYNPNGVKKAKKAFMSGTFSKFSDFNAVGKGIKDQGFAAEK